MRKTEIERYGGPKALGNGGAFAYGHLFQQTGARITTGVLIAVRSLGRRQHLARSCAGGGAAGIAMTKDLRS